MSGGITFDVKCRSYSMTASGYGNKVFVTTNIGQVELYARQDSYQGGNSGKSVAAGARPVQLPGGPTPEKAMLKLVYNCAIEDVPTPNGNINNTFLPGSIITVISNDTGYSLATGSKWIVDGYVSNRDVANGGELEVDLDLTALYSIQRTV